MAVADVTRYSESRSRAMRPPSVVYGVPTDFAASLPPGKVLR